MEKALDQLEKTAVPSSRQVMTLDNMAAIASTLTLFQDRPKPPFELTRLIETLLGMTTLSPRGKLDSISFFDPFLNPSQQEATKFALSSNEIACIHGPPGIYRKPS